MATVSPVVQQEQKSALKSVLSRGPWYAPALKILQLRGNTGLFLI